MIPEIYNFEQLLERAREVYQIILSSRIQEMLFPLKVIFIIVSIIFIFGIIFFLSKTSYLRDTFLEDLEDLSRFKGFGQKKWLRRWNKIKKKVEKGKSSTYWKIGLIEANKMLDEVLKKTGLGIGTIEDRLKRLTESDVSNLTQLLAAHQVCQDIIRDPDYKLSREKAEELINVFERSFRDLRVF